MTRERWPWPRYRNSRLEPRKDARTLTVTLSRAEPCPTAGGFVGDVVEPKRTSGNTELDVRPDGTLPLSRARHFAIPIAGERGKAREGDQRAAGRGCPYKRRALCGATVSRMRTGRTTGGAAVPTSGGRAGRTMTPPFPDRPQGDLISTSRR